ncbi:low temperature viability 1 family protein [Mycolicibacterium baixiangningiae]|uniref:low temperature viability 1 family protein n=1 Tax=Mycolicibacterium baixiangningiae TaxID=2761578 RepID=UPI001E5C0470|nr:low temperature viability 1 family protein [Mycolicibacterium baixiangningiae]
MPDVGKGPSPRDNVGSDLDTALREAVETLESSAYQDGNPAFDAFTMRDWLVMWTVYGVVPIVLALVVWLS